MSHQLLELKTAASTTAEESRRLKFRYQCLPTIALDAEVLVR